MVQGTSDPPFALLHLHLLVQISAIHTPKGVVSTAMSTHSMQSKTITHTHIYLSLQGRVNIFMRRPNSTVESSKLTANESLTAPLQNRYKGQFWNGVKEMGQTATCVAMFNNMGTNNLVLTQHRFTAVVPSRLSHLPQAEQGKRMM